MFAKQKVGTALLRGNIIFFLGGVRKYLLIFKVFAVNNCLRPEAKVFNIYSYWREDLSWGWLDSKGSYLSMDCHSWDGLIRGKG